jgi:uncharacterized membrane protein YoaK (UPF0700 family)
MADDTPTGETPEQERTFTKEVKVAGRDLVKRVRKLVAEGNVRRLIIRKADGTRLLEIPLTAGAAIGGVLTIAQPVLAMLGALAMLLAEFKVEVVHVKDQGEE